MRAALLLASLLLPAVAHAELSETERIGLAAAVGAVVATYAAVNTVFMFNDLLEKGWSEPKHTVPAAFLAGVALVTSVAGLAIWARAGDEVGMVGGGLAAISSAALCFFVTLAIHGWAIRAPPSALPEAAR